MYICISIVYVPGAPGGQDPGVLWVLEVEPESSARISSALNYGAMSSAPDYKLD